MAKADFKAPSDLVQLIIDNIRSDRRRSLDYHIEVQIATGSAALHTTGATCLHVLYHLAKHPEYIDPIRGELEALSDFATNRSIANKLVKLDSFIRECQRWSSVVQSMTDIPDPSASR